MGFFDDVWNSIRYTGTTIASYVSEDCERQKQLIDEAYASRYNQYDRYRATYQDWMLSNDNSHLSFEAWLRRNGYWRSQPRRKTTSQSTQRKKKQTARAREQYLTFRNKVLRELIDRYNLPLSSNMMIHIDVNHFSFKARVEEAISQKFQHLGEKAHQKDLKAHSDQICVIEQLLKDGEQVSGK